GLIALSAGTLPTILRPWVDRRADERQRRDDWLDQARALCVNLEEHLRRMKRDTLLNMSTVAMSTWGESSELRRQTPLVVRFGPNAARSLGADLLDSMEALQVEAPALTKVRDLHESNEFAKAATRYETCHALAESRLRLFERALGDARDE